MKHLKKFNESFLASLAVVITSIIGIKVIGKMILSDFVTLGTELTISSTLKSIEKNPEKFIIRCKQLEDGLDFTIKSKGVDKTKLFPMHVRISQNGKSTLKFPGLSRPLGIKISEGRYKILEDHLKKYGQIEEK